MFADRCRRVHHNPIGESMHNSQISNARDGYTMFHHGDSKHSRTVQIPDPPKDAYVIGRLTEVVYLPYLSSKKHHERYSHQFGDTGYSKDNNPEHAPLLLADKDDNLYISRDNSKYNISDRGIVG